MIGPGENPVTNPGYQPDQTGTPHPSRTYIGFLAGGTAGTSLTRYIDLGVMSGTATLPVQNNTNNPADPPSNVIDAPAKYVIDTPLRLSVSEPIDGSGVATVYDDIEAELKLKLPSLKKDPNGRYMNGSTPTAFDVPFDKERPTDDDDTKAIKAKLKNNHTEAAFRMIYLQRLANPLLPHDANNNPYRTVDSMAVDLTVFNGISNATDPDNANGEIHFETRQRGENNDKVTNSHINTDMNLWKQEPVDKSQWARSRDLADDSYFKKALRHSLGYLNQPFGTPQVNNTTGEKGLPASPFPWLTWNNRPYVSPLELMLVPALSSSRLLANASSGTQATDPSSDEYCTGFNFVHAGNSGTLAVYSTDSFSGAKVRYPHLLDFFQSSSGGSSTAELHRVLDQLGVPSPFVGTDVWANPTMAANSTGHAYHPPFNRISTYREPGRINLNTIYDKDVFDALMAGAGSSSGSVPSWHDFKHSRGSFPDIPDPTVPTEFAHPFRSFAGASMIPTLTGDPLKPKLEIDATLLREGPTAEHPLFEFTSTRACDNTDRNPYFYYQGLQRLGNLVTTRSNVFAVWITVGYFEVEPASQAVAKLHSDWTPTQVQTYLNNNPSIYPDGYALGRELGLDTGQVERHRGFYIIDRSLPVGFQRGQELNSDKTILVNRFIE